MRYELKEQQERYLEAQGEAQKVKTRHTHRESPPHILITPPPFSDPQLRKQLDRVGNIESLQDELSQTKVVRRKEGISPFPLPPISPSALSLQHLTQATAQAEESLAREESLQKRLNDALQEIQKLQASTCSLLHSPPLPLPQDSELVFQREVTHLRNQLVEVKDSVEHHDALVSEKDIRIDALEKEIKVGRGERGR